MAENRTAIVPFENRIVTVQYENRTINTVGGGGVVYYFRFANTSDARVDSTGRRRIAKV